MFVIKRSALAAVIICVFASLWPALASAQQQRLKLPTIAASAAATADWATTYHGLKYFHVRETNRLLHPWNDSPGQLISVGAAIDAGTITAWNLVVGRRHPRVAVAGLWAMAAFRTYLAIQNIRTERKSLKKRGMAPASASATPKQAHSN